MDKINIQNIFGSTKKLNKPSNKKEESLNIENLVRSNAFENNITDIYLVDKIKNIKEKDNKKLLNLYSSMYAKCLKRIDNSISSMNTYIIHDVDLAQYGYDKYIPLECILFIKNSLDESGFDTHVISDSSIFVSWEKIINS